MSVRAEDCAFSPLAAWVGGVPPICAMRGEGHGMTQYLITFPSDAMNHIPDEEMPDVGRAAHAVCQELIDAVVHLLTGGLDEAPSSLTCIDRCCA